MLRVKRCVCRGLVLGKTLTQLWKHYRLPLRFGVLVKRKKSKKAYKANSINTSLTSWIPLQSFDKTCSTYLVKSLVISVWKCHLLAPDNIHNIKALLRPRKKNISTWFQETNKPNQTHNETKQTVSSHLTLIQSFVKGILCDGYNSVERNRFRDVCSEN